MANPPDTPAPFSLRRWSQRKREAAREASAPRAGAAGVPAAGAAPVPGSGVATAENYAATPVSLDSPTPAAATTRAVAATPTPAAAEPPLPPVETLTIDSDFTPFMQPKVAEDVKRAALKKLFSDPQFNVMDGLDIYIGDYTQADPMPEGMLDKLGKVYGMLAKTDEPEAAITAEPADASVLADDGIGSDAPVAVAPDESLPSEASQASEASRTEAVEPASTPPATVVPVAPSIERSPR